jgi:hypothetical protein
MIGGCILLMIEMSMLFFVAVGGAVLGFICACIAQARWEMYSGMVMYREKPVINWMLYKGYKDEEIKEVMKEMEEFDEQDR